jgi:hypothetical protein
LPKISFTKLVSSWETLSHAVATQVSEPLVEARRRELEAALAEVMERHSRQIALSGQAANNTQLLHEAIARGKDAEARLRAFLKGTYGRDSVQLFRFGLRPQRKRRRAEAGAPKTGAEPAPAAAVEAATAAAPETEHPRETPAPDPAAGRATARSKPSAGTRRPKKDAPAKRSTAKKAKPAKSRRRTKVP